MTTTTITSRRDGVDNARLGHQLDANQAELEAQNLELRAAVDELSATNAALIVAGERYRLLYERAPIAYVTVDGERVILDVNLAALALFSLPRVKLIGAQLELLIDASARRAFRAFVGEVVLGGHARSDDVVLAHDDDAPAIAVLIEGVAVQSPTAPAVQAVLALVDITTRKEVEAARRKAQDDVLAIVSHDLRGPLNAIVLACDALGSDLDAHEQQQCVAAIQRAATRAGRLINDLLGITRMEAGRLSLQRAWFDLGELVRTMARDYARPVAAAQSTLACEIGDGNLMIHADRDRLHQVVANLVSNALTHARGTAIELSVVDGGHELVLAVVDHGPGIALAEQAQVFERFRQGRRGRGGVGLGLAIVKGLVLAHGGTVTVVSAPDEGARFEVRLPRGE